MPPQASPCNFPESGQLRFVHRVHGELTVSRGLGNVLRTDGAGPLDKVTCPLEQWGRLRSTLRDAGYIDATEAEECVDCSAPVPFDSQRCEDCAEEFRALKHYRLPSKPRSRYARPT